MIYLKDGTGCAIFCFHSFLMSDSGQLPFFYGHCPAFKTPQTAGKSAYAHLSRFGMHLYYKI